MISAALLVTVLKWGVLAACSMCWIYAAYHGTVFEGRLKTRNPFEIEELNRPSTLFSSSLSNRAIEARRKVFVALSIFAVLGLCLLMILYFDASGPATSPFLFKGDRPG